MCVKLVSHKYYGVTSQLYDVPEYVRCCVFISRQCIKRQFHVRVLRMAYGVWRIKSNQLKSVNPITYARATCWDFHYTCVSNTWVTHFMFIRTQIA